MNNQMKIAVYSCTEAEEMQLRICAVRQGLSLKTTKENISLDNIKMTHGCMCCIINHSVAVTSEILDALYANGIRYLSTRIIGYDHIDMEYAVKIGMCVGNTVYSSKSVAEYAVM